MSFGLTRRGFRLSTSVLLLASPLSAGAGPFVYVANSGSNDVYVIDTATNVVTATIPVGLVPYGVAVTKDGKRVYVTNNSSSDVSVIDTALNKVIATVSLGWGDPIGVAVAPDGKHAYVAKNNAASVSVIDTTTNTVTADIPAGIYPFGIAVAPDGKRVYVTNGTTSMWVIDTTTNAVTTTVHVGYDPFGVAAAPDGKHIYIAAFNSHGVSEIDAVTFAWSGAGIVDHAYSVAVTPDSKYVYATSADNPTVSVIDTATKIPVPPTITVDYLPHSVVVTPDGKRAYVTHPTSNKVSVINTTTNTVIGTISVGKWPKALGIQSGLPAGSFLTFNPKLGVNAITNYYSLTAAFTLSPESDGIFPLIEPVTIVIGPSTLTIPARSFKANNLKGTLDFTGFVNGTSVTASFKPGSAQSNGHPTDWAFSAKVTRVSVKNFKSPVPVTLTVGNDFGSGFATF